MVDCCMGLVVVDDKSSVICLVHYSVQEYLSNHRNHVFDQAESAIVKRCLTYLLFTPFETGPRKVEVELQDLIAENVFASYAARYWGDHVRAAANEDVDLLTLRFLRAGPQRGCSNQIMRYTRDYREEYWRAKEAYSVNGLHLAASFGLENVCRKLLEGSEVELNDCTHMGTTALIRAAASGHKDVVRLLMSKGADFTKENWYGTALHCAAESGTVATILELVENGVHVDIRDRRGHTSLHCATMSGHPEAIKVLLEKGAAINAICHKKYTALRYAIVWEQAPEIVQILLENKADTSIRSKRGQTPLHDAAVMNSEDALLLLLKYKADVEAREKHGATPLHFAAEKNHVAILRHLLNHRADVNSKTIDGVTAIYLASRNGGTETMKGLIDAGGDIEAADKEGLTPLVVAVRENNEAVVRLLLDAGADIEAKDEEGHNLIQVAVRESYHAVATLLKAAKDESNKREIFQSRTNILETDLVQQRIEAVPYHLDLPEERKNFDSMNVGEVLAGRSEAAGMQTAKPSSDDTVDRSEDTSSRQYEKSAGSYSHIDNGGRADTEPGNDTRAAVISSGGKRGFFRPRCMSCRKRKLKCEPGNLKCINCEVSGRECQYNDERASEPITRKTDPEKALDKPRVINDANLPTDMCICGSCRESNKIECATKQHMEESPGWACIRPGANNIDGVISSPLPVELMENLEGPGKHQVLNETAREVDLLKDAISLYDTSRLHINSDHDDVTRASDQCEKTKAPRLRELLVSRLRMQEMVKQKVLEHSDTEASHLGTTTSEISDPAPSIAPSVSLDHTMQLKILEERGEGRIIRARQEPPSPVIDVSPPRASTIRSAPNAGCKIFTCQETACLYTNEDEDQYKQHMENAHGWVHVRYRPINDLASPVSSHEDS